VFQIGPGTQPETQLQLQPADRETEITAAGFSGVVDLCLEYPGMLPATFSEYRDRLKKGDQVYLVRKNSRVELAAWIGTRGMSELLTLKHSRLASGAPAMTIYECSAAPGPDPAASYEKLLSHLAQEAVVRKMDLLVCCQRNQSTLRAVLVRQGFRPKYRAVHRKVFHLMQHDSVHELPPVET